MSGGGTTLATPSGGFSPSTMLARIKTVDGTGSGLDADLVRGVTPSTAGLSVLALASIALGGLILGSGANTVGTLAIGSASTFLKSNGTTAAWSALDAGDIGTGTLAAARGGTGLASYAVGDLIYASAGTTLAKLAGVATGNALISGGVTTAPSWGKIDLTAHISGILPSTAGGTGVNNAGTITNATATTITGGGTLALGGFTLTVPATGTAGLLAVANTWTALNTFSSASGLSITGAGGLSVTTGTAFVVGAGAGVVIEAGANARALSTYVNVNAAAGNNRAFTFQTGGSFRWLVTCNGTAESGSNAGSDFAWNAYDDAGGFIDSPLTMIRAAGSAMTIVRPLALSTASNGLTISKTTGTTLTVSSTNAAAIACAGGITTGSATLHTTSAALTNGAAASLGTLTNAPAAGNPTKWVPINDNGTTRFIPCW